MNEHLKTLRRTHLFIVVTSLVLISVGVTRFLEEYRYEPRTLVETLISGLEDENYVDERYDYLERLTLNGMLDWLDQHYFEEGFDGLESWIFHEDYVFTHGARLSDALLERPLALDQDMLEKMLPGLQDSFRDHILFDGLRIFGATQAQFQTNVLSGGEEIVETLENERERIRAAFQEAGVLPMPLLIASSCEIVIIDITIHEIGMNVSRANNELTIAFTADLEHSIECEGKYSSNESISLTSITFSMRANENDGAFSVFPAGYTGIFRPYLDSRLVDVPNQFKNDDEREDTKLPLIGIAPPREMLSVGLILALYGGLGFGLIHLAEVKRILEAKEIDDILFPWVCTYGGMSARVAEFLSLFLLPFLGVMIGLSSSAGIDPIEWYRNLIFEWTIWISVVAAGGLGIAFMICTRQIRGIIRPESGDSNGVKSQKRDPPCD